MKEREREREREREIEREETSNNVMFTYVQITQKKIFSCFEREKK